MKLSSANLQVRSAQQLNSHGAYTKTSNVLFYSDQTISKI
jgi:hypothetical protein